MTFECIFTGLFPGVSAAAAKERTGWDLAVAAIRVVAGPSPAELDALRNLQGWAWGKNRVGVGEK